MTDNSGGERAGPRNNLFLLTLLCDHKGEEIGKARIRNLSVTGMMVQGDFELQPGQIGIRFHREINPMLVRRPVSSADQNDRAIRIFPT